MEVIFKVLDDILIARIKGDVDHHTAKAIREKIDAMLFESRAHLLIIDFGRVEFMDSSGLGLILGRVDRAGALGATVEVRGLSPRLHKLLRLSGLERVAGLSLVK